jgi:hypothetical protein
MNAGMKVTYARTPARFSGRWPTLPWARGSPCMERPQPGQNAAVLGIWAAQCGHEASGTFVSSIVGHHIKTRGGQQMVDST